MMTIPVHKPFFRGSSCVCADCGLFLFDVRTGARLRALTDVDPKKLAAVERRFSSDPELAKRLASEDLYEVISTYKFADKFNDFLNNPQARPDLQTPEATNFLNVLSRGGYVNDKTDAMTPWLAREWKKGRVQVHPRLDDKIRFNGGDQYEYPNEYGETESWHTLHPDELNHWADWNRSDHPSRKGKDIMQMQTPEMHETIKDWDRDMREKAEGAATSRGDILHTYPDGWTVQNINSERALEDEGDKMGHCVGSYWPDVQSGKTLIHSLRDHTNAPHATWEITPTQYLGPDGKTYTGNEPNGIPAGSTPMPQKGKMVQIQGKANERPLPEYQKRIKDYFEKQMPDPTERPQWGDQEITSGDDLEGDEYGYHSGDYGLEKPNMTYDWGQVLNDVSPNWSYGSYGETAPSIVVKRAQEEGQLHQLEQARRKWHEVEEAHYLGTEYEHDYPDAHRELEQQYVKENPPPEVDRTPGTPQAQHYFDWEDAREKAIDRQLEEQRRENWNQHENNNYSSELEVEINAAKLRAKKEAEGQQEPHQASMPKTPHANYSTGEPCFCTFHKEYGQRWAALDSMVCQVCGDPLEHGNCKRCDWTTGPSNAMGPGDSNPPDPTKEMHPGIQASAKWRLGSPPESGSRFRS